MRAPLMIAWLGLSCGAAAPAASPDAAAPAADARQAIDGALVEDLDMQLADFATARAELVASGRGYGVANLLGHEAEALAAARSTTGGVAFPVGSVVETSPSEVMVKRRAGWNPATNDWEFFRVGQTIELRGAEETDCFMCHSSVSSLTWDYICNHP